MSDLPDKIVQLETLRINRNVGKRCKCPKPNYVVDPDNREVTCGKCGSRVDPFDAMYTIARDWEGFRDDVDRLHEQRKEIMNYKPWLVVIKNAVARIKRWKEANKEE